MDETPTDSATQTVIKTLEEAAKRLTEAEKMAPGPNSAAILELIRVVRAQNRVIRHLVRTSGVGNELMRDGR